MDVGGRP